MIQITENEVIALTKLLAELFYLEDPIRSELHGSPLIRSIREKCVKALMIPEGNLLIHKDSFGYDSILKIITAHTKDLTDPTAKDEWIKNFLSPYKIEEIF